MNTQNTHTETRSKRVLGKGHKETLTRTQNKFVKNAIRTNILSPFKRDRKTRKDCKRCTRNRGRARERERGDRAGELCSY